MRSDNPRRHRGIRALGVGIAVGAMLIATAPAGMAAPAGTTEVTSGAEAHATAQAVNLNLGGTLTLQVSEKGTKADNDGNDPVAPMTNSPDTSTLSGQAFLGAGALKEVAEADTDGSSYACAGIVSPDGGLQIGDQGRTCTDTGKGSGGVTIGLSQIPSVGSALSGIVSVDLIADSLISHAFDDSVAGTQDGDASILGLKVHVCVLAALGGCAAEDTIPVVVPSGENQNLLGAVIEAIAGSSALSSVVATITNALVGVVNLTSNYQHTQNGVLTVSAMRVSLADNAVATADLAGVTVGKNTKPGPCNPFEDVDDSNKFCQDILWLKIAGITNGYDDGRFYHPAWPETRQAMAAFLFRYYNPTLEDPNCTSPSPFSDISDNPFCGAIGWMESSGLSNGYKDGTYRPDGNVSRQAVAAFLYRATHDGGDAPACAAKPFDDVATDGQFCGEIAWFKEQGITSGYTDQTFRETNQVSRQAMAAWIHNYSTLYPRELTGG